MLPRQTLQSAGADRAYPKSSPWRPRSETKLGLVEADINYAISSEFAQEPLRNLDAAVDCFDWRFYAANGRSGALRAESMGSQANSSAQCPSRLGRPP